MTTDIAVDFGDLFSQYHERLYAYVYRRTSDQALAEDLAAETFVKALEATKRGSGTHSHVSGWLYRIAHNLIIDHYRVRDHQRHLSLDDIPNLPDDHRPEIEMEEKWLRECIEDATKRLNDQQCAFVHYKLEGFSFDEIAELLGTTNGGAKALQHRAFVNMAGILSKELERERVAYRVADAPTTATIQSYLQQHGPKTVAELCYGARLTYSVVRYALDNCPQLFAVMTVRHKTQIWGAR